MICDRRERALRAVEARAAGEALSAGARVTVHFHPDRLHAGAPILAALARDGVYRSQFETGTSNGGLTAWAGGDRWRWESRIFDGAYDDADPSERPKYGALDVHDRPFGAAPRFGSAFFRLAPHTLERTTFCFPDSVFEPTHFGTARRMALVALAASTRVSDPLDEYIEAQIHGSVSLDSDVEALVLDPCFRGTDVDREARTLPCRLEWHPGFRLHRDELERHPDYRGVEVVELARTLFRDAWLTPRDIGDASRTGRFEAQSLKRVWHYVARFGQG